MIPAEFMEEMQALLGPQEAEALRNALKEEPTVAIRLNPAKPCALPPALSGESVEWHPFSRRLATRPQFTLMPPFHAGAFYVQDPSSMIVSRIVESLTHESDAPIRMLDACAAPGGKSTCALDALPPGSLLVSNEYEPKRAAVLVENVCKWGAPNVIVTQGDTSRLSALRDTFDIILADAPCSGEGMMRKDMTAREQWSRGLVRQCAALQAEILDNLWPALRPGGFLIYSTCTFNLDEDERQAARLMEDYGAESIDPALPDEWGIGRSLLPGVHALRFMLHITRGEGLFLSVLRKPGDAPAAKKKNKGGGKQKSKPGGKTPDCLASWLSAPAEFEFRRTPEGEWTAFPREHAPLLRQIETSARVIHAGIHMATEKGKDIIPAHSLALNTALREGAFPRVEFSEAQALDYLRKEAVTLPADTPRGYVLATHAGLPLGFLKNLGNRANNLYPAPWRIRHL